MANPTPLRALSPEEAKAKRDEIVTKARAEGREQGRKEWAPYAQEAANAAVSAALEPIKAQQADVLKHAKAAAWARGGIIGLLVGTAFGATVVNIFLGAAFDQATRMSRETTITGALIQQQNAPDRCLPGEQLPDGRVCPQR